MPRGIPPTSWCAPGSPAPTNPEACYTLPAPGSTALTIEPGSVTYVGTVDLGTTNPTPWPVEQYLTTSVYGQDLALVDGWISAGIAPPCPMPANGVDPNLPFGCGAAAWLTTDPFQATTSSAGSTDLVEPGRGIRVQNNAFDDFSPTTTAVDSIGLPAAQHGFFLLAPATAPANCFLCSTEVAEILGRVDPVGIPALTTASTPEPQGTVPTPVPTSMDPLATKAFEMASQFESARATGDWATAWSLLGPATQQVFGSQQRFADQEEACNGTGADVFDVTAPVQDPAEIGTSMLGPAWNELVPANAWYVAIDHPKVVGASAGLEGLVVAIAKDGEWRVWIVH